MKKPPSNVTGLVLRAWPVSPVVRFEDMTAPVLVYLFCSHYYCTYL